MAAKLKIVLRFGLIFFFLITTGCSSIERRLLFWPSHESDDKGLSKWIHDGQVIGFSRTVESPKNVWLMIHGNGGQAVDRVYALPRFSPEDSVFILEYPGFGKRRGKISMESFNAAAQEAYFSLRHYFPHTPVCVAGESIGTGPSSFLATVTPPPDKIVLVVPFDVLSSVAKDHMPHFLVNLMLRDKWDNVSALANYKGPVQLFAGISDTTIPPYHAKALAAAVTNANLILFDGGHNDWSRMEVVKIRNP